jgi:hypothetical protein
MIDTKLIMLEGLPGTGKSTNSHFLSMQLALEGKAVKWFHEVARPHPVLFFSEASLTVEEYRSFLIAYPQSEQVLNRIAVFRKASVAIDLLELEWNYCDEIGRDALIALQAHDVWTFPLDRYAEVALEKWAFFAEKAKENDGVSILDSSIFQFQIFTFLLKAAPAEKTERFILKLLEIVKPLNPCLIYFYRENARDTVDFLEKLRGTEFLQGIWERDKAEPYYKNKPTGAQGQKQFLLDYAAIAAHLFELADCRKLAIEITTQNWRAYEDELLSFLGARRKPYPNALPPNGVFRNEALALNIEIDALMMKDPYGKERPLTPKSNFEFYVDCLPVVLYYNGLDRIKVSGGQICERWTTTGTEFIRI